MNDVSFEKILSLFEAKGWKLGRIIGRHRVFVKKGELPFLIPVVNKKVDIEYFEKVKEFLGIEC